MRMSDMLPEALGIRDADPRPALCAPPSHRIDIVVQAVLHLQPFALARVACERGGLAVDYRGDVDRRRDGGCDAEQVLAADRIGIVEIRNSGPRRIRRLAIVVRYGRVEAGVTDEPGSDLVVEHIVDRRRRDHDLWIDAPQMRGDPLTRGIVECDCEVLELQAGVSPRADRLGGHGRLRTPDRGYLRARKARGALIARRHCRAEDFAALL